MKLLQQGLVAEAPGVRRAATLAILSLKWNVVLPDLRAALLHESDPEVRETMVFVQERLTRICMVRLLSTPAARNPSGCQQHSRPTSQCGTGCPR